MNNNIIAFNTASSLSKYPIAGFALLSCTLSMCYTCMQSIKHKGKISSDTQMYLSCWAICIILVAFVIWSACYFTTLQPDNAFWYMIAAFIITMGTLCTSVSNVYWTL